MTSDDHAEHHARGAAGGERRFTLEPAFADPIAPGRQVRQSYG